MISTSSSSSSKNLPTICVVIVCALIALNQLMVTTIEAQAPDLQQRPFVASSLINGDLGSNDLVAGFSGGRQQASSSMPGHYEFEVAPKMEPPSVRKPPYQQSATQSCPESDPFAGFSPKDTLCGNLNEGRVPLNPLGQNINDQSYPFELIKNKTLQFLARALPVLKLEYDTIPKVARYLPGQHLLNPTHLSSPLGHEHFHRLNQRLAGLDYSHPYSHPGGTQPSAGRRRRKRALAHASYTVAAEMLPNASLLVSSAHSGPGRIRDFMGHQSSGGPESPPAPHPMAVITKDGYKPIAHQNLPQSSSSLSSLALKQAANQNGAVGNSTQSASSPRPAAVEQSNNNSSLRQATQSSSASLPQNNNKVGGLESRQQQQQQQQQGAGNTQVVGVQSITVPSTTTSTTTATAQAGNSQQQPQQRNHAKATTADIGQGAATAVTAAAASQTARSAEQQHQSSSTTAKPSAGNGSHNSSTIKEQQQSSSGLSKRRSLMSCSDSTNGFSSVICQAAVALIEGNERQPVWLQMMKHLGNALAGPSAEQTPAAANNPVWTILSGLSAVSQAYNGGGSNNNEAQSKSAGQPTSSGKPLSTLSSSSSNILQLIGPITSLLSSATSSGSRSSSSSSSSSSSKESNSSADESTHKAADLAAAPSSFGSALANSLGSSTVAKLALAGWASNAVAGLLDYFAPSLFSSATRGFARRKKPYDPLEQFVDTPASLAALTAAAASSNQAQSRQNGGASKQPPTPCPSVEEYISPTFARNYQGTWKYVIQIPHEGYFTQTIQRTSCVRQRCEFTDGVCHESPRWVSLLVAEIYYPHAVFSQPGGGGAGSTTAASDQASSATMMMQQPSLMSASPSVSSIQQMQPTQAHQHQQRLQQQYQQQQPRATSGQTLTSQDPLQMTDSLSTYNHNLNSAFIEAANGLGLDPNNVASMQQLANAYNYELLQRNGLLSSQSGQQPESRSSTLNTNPLLGASSNQQQYSIQPAANQPLQQQQQQQPQNQLQSNANNDYILSLAAAALQQNPQLSVSDLIASLQQSLSRKRRDLGANRSPANSWSPHQQQQQQQQNGGHKIQQRSSANTSPQSNNGQPIDQSVQVHPMAMNEIPSSGQPNQQSPFNKVDSLEHHHHPESSGAGSNVAAAASSVPNHQAGSDAAAAAGGAAAADQTECDGHDKIGCYVVRVYYDWFLVNGSCKCWKTTGAGQQQQQQQSGQQSGNSLIRRIFTG